MSMTDEQDVGDIRDDIDRTREDMSQTIDQIQARLAPDALKEQAQDSIQQIADQILAEVRAKTGDLTTSLTDQINAAVHSATAAKTDQVLTQAGDTARQVGASLWERIGQNPAPIALAALGLGVAASQLLRAGGDDDAPSPSTPGSNGSGMTGGVSAAASNAAGTMRDSADRAVHKVQEGLAGATQALPSMPTGVQGLVQEQPWAFGALALGIGLVVGLGLPETQSEREAMEPARERVQQGLTQAASAGAGVLDQAKGAAAGLATDAKAAATDVANEAKSAAKEAGRSAV